MASTNTPTVIDLKTAFLRTQIQALSQPIRPSSTVLSTISATENALRQRNIDEALLKLNAQLKRHNKVSYGPQALRHVAEQIDKLYWNAGEAAVTGGVLVEGEEWAERGVDLRKENIIDQLPDEWSEEAEQRAPEKSTRYRELQQRLAVLNAKRKEAREKLERHKGLKELLEPFEDAGQNIQGNLVGKGNEVERELERMKLLMFRVQRGIQGLEEKQDEVDKMDIDEMDEGDRKVLALLGGT